jgi:hypothetical protein
LILRPALDILGNEGPLVANNLLFLKKHQIFLGCPLLAFDIWGKKIDPTLPTLLALPLIKAHFAINLSSNLLPLFGAPFCNKLP